MANSIPSNPITTVVGSIDNFEARLVSVLTADSILTGNLKADSNGLFPIYPSGMQPVGNVFPQITFLFDEGPSEDALPAVRRSLTLTVWVAKLQKQPYSKLQAIADRLNQLINREAGEFVNIDIPTNSGLRTALVLKTSGGYGFNDELDKHFWEIIYDIVISEEESFAASDSGDQSWI